MSSFCLIYTNRLFDLILPVQTLMLAVFWQQQLQPKEFILKKLLNQDSSCLHLTGLSHRYPVGPHTNIWFSKKCVQVFSMRHVDQHGNVGTLHMYTHGNKGCPWTLTYTLSNTDAHINVCVCVCVHAKFICTNMHHIFTYSFITCISNVTLFFDSL